MLVGQFDEIDERAIRAEIDNINGSIGVLEAEWGLQVLTGGRGGLVAIDKFVILVTDYGDDYEIDGVGAITHKCEE